MQIKFSAALALGVAIVLATAMVCATVLALNLKTTYAIGNGSDNTVTGTTYARLLRSGCESTGYVPGGTPIAVSCPLWVRP